MTKCKNCGKDIYKANHGDWYHSDNDYEICRANEPVNPARWFDKAEPDEASG